MKLSLEALAAALNITQRTAERWIRQGSIPVRIKDGDCFFNQHSLRKWAQDNNLTYRPKDREDRTDREDRPDTLCTAMERGGVYYDIDGGSVEDVLKAGVNCIPCLNTQGQLDGLYESLLAREELMSTGIGKGVAIPHPRTPLDYGDIPAFITTCFLRQPVDYKAVDHLPVFVIFILTCPSSRRHLHLLARISFCLRDEAFVDFLKNRPGPDAFFEKIAEFDKRFDTPS